MNHDYYMRKALNCAKLSPDPRTQIGAVIVHERGTILAIACNKPHPKTLDYEVLGIPKNMAMHHAERGAIAWAVRAKHDLNKVTLVTNGVPCHNCAHDIIAYGIKNLVVHSRFDELIPEDKHEYFGQCEKMLLQEGVSISRCSTKFNMQLLFDGEVVTI